MKKILLSVVLAVSCNMSFGQNVTDFTFTGMLAKTVFQQFSLNAAHSTIETAGKSTITAIAGPNVDVANITDMAFTISNGSSLITSPSPAGPVPTNYTGSIMPITGLVFTDYPFIYLKNTAGDRYRGVNIFIHKLVPTSVPYIVANTQQADGFAHCGEVANTGGGTPQLHTNGQAIYLAFNAAADVVKFQIENGGTVGNVNANAYIRVEKSADLSTWTSLQDIQLVAPETVPVKTDYAITIGDASARYIRIRIEGLVNSRSSRRETIRNIAVQLTPVITWNQDLTKFLISDIGGADTILDATTSSSADTNSSPITYTSSDANVAIVVENKLTVVGEGTAVITAKQPANKYYTAATDVVKNVTVSASLGTNSVEKAKENNFIFVNSEGIVSNIEGTLKVYAINGALLKNIAVSKNQVIPVDKGQYIVITTINGKSISKLIVK